MKTTKPPEFANTHSSVLIPIRKHNALGDSRMYIELACLGKEEPGDNVNSVSSSQFKLQYNIEKRTGALK